MLIRRSIGGFTIIELMVAVTIVAILMALVVPTFGGMIQNSKIGSSSKSYLIGLQTARAEAIRRNVPVEFVLTDTPISSGVATTAVPATNGKNWVVRWSDPAASGGYVAIEAKSALEGGGRTGSSTVEVAGVAVSPGSFNGIVTFNGFGGTTSGVTLDVSNPVGGACAPTGPMRCQRVQVRPGGQINACDPAAATSDSRACPP